MRKLMLTVVASCAVVALIPATALAQRHHRARHHARVHHKRLGSDPTSPTTTPTTTPTLSVASFDPATNMLTISNSSTTNGGSVSGAVTPDTRLICISPQMQSTGEDRSHDGGGWGGQWGGDNGGGDNGGGDNSQGDESNQSCSTANLTTGTPVQFADLSMSSNGNNWDVVVLITQPSTVPTVPDTDNDGD